MINNFNLSIETTTGIMEVTQPQPETVIEKVNRLAKECGYNNITTQALQVYRDAERPNGVTLLFNRNPDESFNLNPVTAAYVTVYNTTGRNYVPSEFTGVVAIHRINVSYSALSRINTAVDMQRFMGPLINEAVKDFIDEVGDIGVGYTITAKRPGNDNVYFRDIDDMAGMEFRLCLIKG